MKEEIISSGLFDEILVTQIKNSRGCGKEELKAIFSDHPVDISDNVADGLKRLLSLHKEGDRSYITGSLYLAGEVKEYLPAGGNHD